MNVLINSAAYVSPELAAEFGLLPPVMLPLGIRRLLEHQVAALQGAGRRLFVSLPDSFRLDAADDELFARLGVAVLRLPERLSLGESIARSLALMPADGPLTLHHGDTLLAPPEAPGTDAWVVADSSDGYRWGYARVDGDLAVSARTLDPGSDPGSDEKVLCGHFVFSDTALLARALAASGFDFIGALAGYASARPVRACGATGWSDFGHVQTLYRSRGAYASARVFNHLRIGRGVVRKSGDDARKISAEAHWFSQLPAHLAPYTARLIDAGNDEAGRAWYSTEYEYLPTLQELFVFGRLDHHVWSGVLDACLECLQDFAATPAGPARPGALHELAVAKTRARMDRFDAAHDGVLALPGLHNGVPVPSVRAIAEQMFAIVEAAEPREACVMHGDFCFSNLMFNSRTHRVRLLDPRGSIDDREPTIAGDLRYDMAKLVHSVVGYYDLIVCNHHRLRVTRGERLDIGFEVLRATVHDRLARRLLGLQAGGVRFGDPVVLAVTVCLFIAMLPLHTEQRERQFAFVANVQRLYLDHFAPRR